MSQVQVICEIGVNHNGDLGLAKEMIAAAAECKVDVIKFQTAIPELVQIEAAPKARYQTEFTGSETTSMEMTRSFHFKHEVFLELKEEVERHDCEFLSTAFDLESLEFLESLNPKRYKVPSGEITNLPYLRRVASFGKPVILSTGVSYVDEVVEAFNVLLHGGLEKDQITVLQCTTAYPTPNSEANVSAMLNLQRATGGKMGYSDHTVGFVAAIAAVSLGATVIEKHFTTDKSLPGPDQHASMEPHEFSEMVRLIREVEVVLGTGEKFVNASESENRSIARRGVYASHSIKAGSVITESDLVVLRPENSISPMEIEKLIGRRTKSDLDKHDALDWGNIVID